MKISPDFGLNQLFRLGSFSRFILPISRSYHLSCFNPVPSPILVSVPHGQTEGCRSRDDVESQVQSEAEVESRFVSCGEDESGEDTPALTDDVHHCQSDGGSRV